MHRALATLCALALAALLSLCTAHPLAANASRADAALAPRAVDARYVFTVFTSTSESNLYVYTSADATTFTALAGPTYTPPTGLIRDPSVMLHTE